jgi:hypothetical protein
LLFAFHNQVRQVGSHGLREKIWFRSLVSRPELRLSLVCQGAQVLDIWDISLPLAK